LLPSRINTEYRCGMLTEINNKVNTDQFVLAKTLRDAFSQSSYLHWISKNVVHYKVISDWEAVMSYKDKGFEYRVNVHMSHKGRTHTNPPHYFELMRACVNACRLQKVKRHLAFTMSKTEPIIDIPSL
jgi:hypothetical protein